MTNLTDLARRVSEDDIRYLVKLADWCAGQGLCQIEGIEDPDEWCCRKWTELDGSHGYSADALAAALIARSEA